MSRLAGIQALAEQSFGIEVDGQVIRFTGTLSIRSPSEIVTPFLRRIHDAALRDGLKQLSVDFMQLRFMNSSSIRSLVDWVEWIRREPEAKRYVLTFLTRSDVLWQKTTLTAIQSLGGELVVVSRGR